MTTIDKKTGLQRHLTYDELLGLEARQNEAARAAPAIKVKIDNILFGESPFYQRMQDAVDDIQMNNMAAQAQAIQPVGQAAAGVPLPPKQPPGPPPPPGPFGGSPPSGSPPPSGGSGSSGASPPGPSGGGNTFGSQARTGRSRTPTGTLKRLKRRAPTPDRRNDGSDGNPPPPAAGAAAMVTPTQMADVNQARMQAELIRIVQEAQDANKRASVAEAVANALHQQKAAAPSHIIHQVFSGAPPPSPPSPQTQPTVSAESVANAVKQAMAAAGKGIQGLMESSGQSLKAVMQAAVSEHHGTPAAPTIPDAPVVSKVKKKTLKSPTKPKKSAQEVARIEKRREAVDKMEYGPEPEIIRKRPADGDAEDEREARPNPAASVVRKRPVEPTPQLTKKTKKDPSAARTEARVAARGLLDTYYKRSAPTKYEINITPKNSRAKRSYEDVLKQVLQQTEEAVKARTGVDVTDIDDAIQRRRRVVQ